MSSLAKAIASFADPTPKVFDPEDDDNIDAVTEARDSDEGEDVDYKVSELRRRTAPLLEDIDPKYAGRKVSKKSLEDVFHKDSENDEAEDENVSDKLSDHSETENSEDYDMEDDLEDEDLDSFKNIMGKQPVSSDKDGSDEGENSDGSDISDEDGSDTKLANQFSNIDVASEIEKGKAIKAQQELWNRLCECRIKLHKLVVIANKLPQSNCWENFKYKGGTDLSENLNKAQNKIKSLMKHWLDLQTELLQRNPETTTLNNDSRNEVKMESDEEIPSDTDEETDELQKIPQQTLEPKRKSLKRKLNNQECGEELAKRHKSLISYRNSVIQKWDEKTRLATGRMTQKSFVAFDNSAVKQIEQILQDKNRLIKRTQLKRTLYRVLGKPDILEAEDIDSDGDNLQEPVSKQDMLLKDYDPEIFDDDDFYRQMLKDVIESQSVSIDPLMLRKQMEIQKTRNKMKRKVDTKASKGRKLRYDVHPKMVNFMAPVQMSTISDEARDNLLKCLFGRSSALT